MENNRLTPHTQHPPSNNGLVGGVKTGNPSSQTPTLPVPTTVVASGMNLEDSKNTDGGANVVKTAKLTAEALTKIGKTGLNNNTMHLRPRKCTAH